MGTLYTCSFKHMRYMLNIIIALGNFFIGYRCDINPNAPATVKMREKKWRCADFIVDYFCQLC